MPELYEEDPFLDAWLWPEGGCVLVILPYDEVERMKKWRKEKEDAKKKAEAGRN